MADSRDLLIEIGTEELPPRALHVLATAFADQVWKGLSDAGIPRHGDLRAYASPRRLGVFIGQLFERGLAVGTKSWGPFVKAAFDGKGNPTAAAQGFASNCGVEVKDLQTLQTDKGPRLYFEGEKPGRATVELVPAVVQKALDKLPIPRRMRWGDGDAQFVRPVHWLVLLFGETVIDAELLGVRANRYTRGHRFLHPAPIHLDQPRDYEDALEKRGYVIADFERRRERVQEEVLAAAAREDAHAELAGALLDEVTALVEWPQALVGNFDPSFLELPEEVITAVLKDQQRYFPLRTADGRLLPRFIAVANIVSRDPGVVRHGNERVIRPRLTDAAFFWRRDRAIPLHNRLAGLKEVVYQKRLGTLYDKTQRVSELAIKIAKHIGADPILTKRAAELSRCDLLTQMVGEFPELQGLMGRHYATHDGEPAEICAAIDEMYRPRFAGDILPKAPVGQALALADKLDTLAGIFAIGELPTGEKDPYGLRRAALSVVRILCETRLPLDLYELLGLADENLPPDVRGAIHPRGNSVKFPNAEAVGEFIVERARNYLQSDGYSTLEVEAVLSLPIKKPCEYKDRLQAVREFLKLPEAAGLAEADKRIRNIINKSGATANVQAANESLMEVEAEKRLFRTCQLLRGQVDTLVTAGQFQKALLLTAQIYQPVTDFFDQVMVNVDNEKIRNNRFALLHAVSMLTNQVAYIAKLAT